ncbi:Para-aminobenzoate synthase, aminase component [hydrothermal vent metagenome]|uniref:Anthranilate synthase component 1 n=1 Tax=hydrothermal vent metagenome TaxID=652676 RepID=A0A3B1DKI7_9ZZZZ
MHEYLYKELSYVPDSTQIFDLFCNEPYAFILDSGLVEKSRGRYSFIGFDPFDVYKGVGAQTLLLLKEKFKTIAPQLRTDLTPLPCGVVGFLGYDYGLYQENIIRRQKEDLDLPDGLFGFYDCIVTIDHLRKRMFVFSSGLPEKDGDLRKRRAQERLDVVVEKIFGGLEKDLILGISDERKHRNIMSAGQLSGRRNCSHPKSLKLNPSLTSDFTKEEYCAAVRRAKEYIAAGDIYQVNLAQRFELEFYDDGGQAWDIYKSLREISPASFSSYFNGGDFQVISSSPERFLCVEKNIVRTRPMKGTRPRGDTVEQDKTLRDEIIKSAKDKAELLMITDLLRNDLGRVCEYGSVHVECMREIEEYTTVFQATSTVVGKLQKDKDCFDVLQACFPGGSITGCPKIRAMEVIEELEPVRRGVYTGSMGYISFSGDMDFNILIRTLTINKDRIVFYVGGGIVADSTPEGEYEETLVKAKAIKECLGVT